MKSELIKNMEDRDTKAYGPLCEKCEQYQKYCRCAGMEEYVDGCMKKPKSVIEYQFYFQINDGPRVEFSKGTDVNFRLNPNSIDNTLLLSFRDEKGNTFEITSEKTN